MLVKPLDRGCSPKFCVTAISIVSNFKDSYSVKTKQSKVFNGVGVNRF